jgi:RNA recognition motif-containing protein
MNIFVGNLSFETTEDDLRDAFEDFGDVEKINLIIDKETGKPKGYGFVMMNNQDEAKDAIHALDGSAFNGRNVTVNQGKPAGGGGNKNSNNNNRRRRPNQRNNRGGQRNNNASKAAQPAQRQES